MLSFGNSLLGQDRALAEAISTERGKAMAKRMFLGVVAALFVFGLGSAAMGADPLYGPSIDHFRCYKTKDLTVPKMVAVPGVSLNDPSDPNVLVEVKKGMKWACAPTDKNGEGIINDAEWLCGYKIKGPKILVPPTQVLTNQFQLPATVQLKKSDILLVPCADPNALP
jgi:hypothetical protein